MKSRRFLCTKTAIVDGEYIYEGQEYSVDKKGNLVLDDVILYPRKGELDKCGYFI